MSGKIVSFENLFQFGVVLQAKSLDVGPVNAVQHGSQQSVSVATGLLEVLGTRFLSGKAFENLVIADTIDGKLIVVVVAIRKRSHCTNASVTTNNLTCGAWFNLFLPPRL